MRHWDLNSGAAKLDQALTSLHVATANVSESWDDETFRRFVETYVAPLEPRVKSLLAAVERLAEILSIAEQQCDEY